MNSTKLQTEIAIFKPQGYLSAANAKDLLDRLTVSIRASMDSVFLIDMSDVEFIDSAALVALIEAFRLCQSLGRKLAICSAAPSVKMVFELTQLEDIIEIFDNRSSFEAAIN